MSSEKFGKKCAQEIELAIQYQGPETVAAVFLEPVQNSGGCFVPPEGYFQEVRRICGKYKIMFVSDEVICAFGRLGYMRKIAVEGKKRNAELTCATLNRVGARW